MKTVHSVLQVVARAPERSFCGQSRYAAPVTISTEGRGGCEPAGSLCCWSNTEPSAHMASDWLWLTHSHTSTGSVHTSPQIHTCSLSLTFYTHAVTLESVVGMRPNVRHYPSCSSSYCVYLHRWRCRCCWRQFCTGPERGLCGGGGMSSDPTDIPTKDHFTLSHLYQLNLLWI